MMSSRIMKDVKSFLKIFPFVVIIFAAYTIVEWVNFNYILTPQKKFALEILVLMADAFLLNAVAIAMLPSLVMKDRKAKGIFEILVDSFASLPKVIISYFFLILLTQVAFEASQSSPIPALIVLVFFIWSPYFVAFEQFAEPTPAKGEDDEEDAIDPFDEGGYLERPGTFFAKKNVWHLGMLRSIEFTSKNASLAISVVFVIWLIRVIPELLIGLTMNTNSSFSAVVLQVLATCLGAVLVNMFVVKSIFRSLEPAQREELAFTFKDYDPKVDADIFMISAPNGIRVAVLCLLVIFTTVVWSERRIQLGSFPEGMSFTVDHVEKNSTELQLKIKLEDPNSKFRWLEPRRFRFLGIDPEEKKKEAETEEADLQKEEIAKNDKNVDLDPSSVGKSEVTKKEPSFESILKMLNEKLIAPSRIVVYDDKKNVIKEGQVSPRSEPLLLVLVFPLKENIAKKPNSLYEISYINPFGMKQVLLTFNEGSFQNIIGKSFIP